jgi:hypothetical protein
MPRNKRNVTASKNKPGAAPVEVDSIDSSVTLRRRKSIAVVERYANFSAIGGAIPLPLANAAAITTLLVLMVKALSEVYEVPFDKNRTRSVLIAV